MRLVAAGQANVPESYNALRLAGPVITHEDQSRLLDYMPRASKIAAAVRLALERPDERFKAMVPLRGRWGLVG
jgi:hypothetical protein